MALYDRLIGRDDEGRRVEGRINPEVFSAVLSELARFDVGIEVPVPQTILESLGVEFSEDEALELDALLLTITNEITIPLRIARQEAIRDILFLARIQTPGYARPSEVMTRLGV